jgi:putative Mg2+ transporter-C (MgtC) family protein
MPWDVVASRLFVALLLGIAIGLERQLCQNTSGLRMNALVAIGAASFVVFGESIAISTIGTPDSLGRISSQIITGIGFLGGGVIMREGGSIKGIATAATLWCSAAIGLFCGAGFIASAVTCTVFVVATNLLLRPVAWSIKKRMEIRHLMPQDEPVHAYTIRVTCQPNGQEHIRALLLQEISEGGLHLQKLESTRAEGSGDSDICVTVTSTSDRDGAMERIVSHLSLQPIVNGARWYREQGQ